MFLVARGTAPRAKRATLKMATVTKAWAGVSSRRSQAVCAAKVARVTRTGAARETAVLSARARRRAQLGRLARADGGEALGEGARRIWLYNFIRM